MVLQAIGYLNLVKYSITIQILILTLIRLPLSLNKLKNIQEIKLLISEFYGREKVGLTNNIVMKQNVILKKK